MTALSFFNLLRPYAFQDYHLCPCRDLVRCHPVRAFLRRNPQRRLAAPPVLNGRSPTLFVLNGEAAQIPLSIPTGGGTSTPNFPKPKDDHEKCFCRLRRFNTRRVRLLSQLFGWGAYRGSDQNIEERDAFQILGSIGAYRSALGNIGSNSAGTIQLQRIRRSSRSSQERGRYGKAGQAFLPSMAHRSRHYPKQLCGFQSGFALSASPLNFGSPAAWMDTHGLAVRSSVGNSLADRCTRHGFGSHARAERKPVSSPAWGSSISLGAK